MRAQSLPTSPVAIAAATLKKRESLARDVERELSECLQSSEAAAAGMADIQNAQDETYGWSIAEEARGHVEDDDGVFAFSDEPCNVRFIGIMPSACVHLPRDLCGALMTVMVSGVYYGHHSVHSAVWSSLKGF
jgi:hypothetical protein